jgi:hypothetical protein
MPLLLGVGQWRVQRARAPSARATARLMTSARDELTKSEAILVAAIESNVPDLVAARTTIVDFQRMIRFRTGIGRGITFYNHQQPRAATHVAAARPVNLDSVESDTQAQAVAWTSRKSARE